MLAKIFGLLLGVIGITTTAINSPARPSPNTPVTETSVVKVVEKTATSANVEDIKNVKDKTVDFNLLKSPVFGTKPATASPVKILSKKAQPKKSPRKPKAGAAPKISTKPNESRTAGAATAPAASSSPAVAAPLLAFNLKPETIVPPVIDFSAINKKSRQAIVNILCVSKTGGSFEPLSGSGVIIDPRGIILTNAHVGQYLLLRDYRVKDFLTCVARTGSPAIPAYTLKLFYISKQWLNNNYTQITSSKPTGTGENDFALLQIVGSTNSDLNLPSTFPFLATDNNENNINTNDSVLLAGYPAGFLGGIAIQRDLYLASTIVQIGKLFTFKNGLSELDAFSLGGSPLAQHGSSGGAVVSGAGKLQGIIVTSTDAVETSARELDAISIPHINRALSAETGLTLDSLFATDLTAFSKTFDSETLPFFTKLLTDQLDSQNH